MNKAILVGRLTRDPEVRYSQGDNATAVARYTIAVDRRFKRDGEPTADFIRASYSDVPLSSRRSISARECGFLFPAVSRPEATRTGTAVKVYTTEVIVEEQEFAESRAESEANRASYNRQQPAPSPSVDAGDGFMNIPDGIDEELPFN